MFRIKIANKENMWLESFDPEVSATDPPSYPTGWLVTTEDPKEALLFLSFAEASDFWRIESVTVPLRPDGRPNRPLTAVSVTIEPC